jgi:hypothetical protein
MLLHIFPRIAKPLRISCLFSRINAYKCTVICLYSKCRKLSQQGYENIGVDKYLSPVSGSKTTIALPEFSGLFAT